MMNQPSDEAMAALIEAHESKIYPAYSGLTIFEIAQMAYENAALRAEVEALRARVGEFVELRSPDESPPVAYANEENKRFRFESCEQVEAIVRMPLTKQMRFGRGNWEGRTEIEWQGGNSPFFGFRIEHEQVVGWRFLPPSE